MRREQKFESVKIVWSCVGECSASRCTGAVVLPRLRLEGRQCHRSSSPRCVAESAWEWHSVDAFREVQRAARGALSDSLAVVSAVRSCDLSGMRC